DQGKAAVWNVTEDVKDISDAVVAKIQVDEVFQGAVDSIVQIEGLWLIDYENAIEIETGDEFGEFDVESIDAKKIVFESNDDITLDEDSLVKLYGNLNFRVADPSDVALRFFAVKEITEPGTYEIRGSVATGIDSWDATKFAGFYYDADDNVKTESLVVKSLDKDNKIVEGNLTYSITPGVVDYEFEAFGNYSVAGFFAEEFVPVFEDKDVPDNSVLAKLVLDDDEAYTLRTGEELELGNGYAIEAKQVDVDGKKAWLTFTKDGEFVEDKIVNIPSQGKAAVWNVTEDVKDISDAVVAKIQVDEVFQGAVDSIVQIEGLWLIDYENAIEIETGDEFGEFDVESIDAKKIVFESNDDITLDEDSSVTLAEGLSFKVADNKTLRYYPFVERTIEGEVTTPVDDKKDKDKDGEKPPVEDDKNVTPTPDVPDVPDVPDEPDVPDVPDEPTEPTEPADEPGIPGFGIVLGLAGLLAVVYLVRRN
ncbi:MAG: S-layer protein domain-containing protein, partial [Methanosarcinaceae archaeon]|nr:S-layer protein domain-containing protein [Methanosarcinaceae archaeon]